MLPLLEETWKQSNSRPLVGKLLVARLRRQRGKKEGLDNSAFKRGSFNEPPSLDLLLKFAVEAKKGGLIPVCFRWNPCEFVEFFPGL